MERSLNRRRISTDSPAYPLLHRSAITAVDKLASAGTLTLTAITEAGSTLTNTAFHVLVSAGNRWGNAPVGADPGAVTPTANQAVRLAFAAVANAEWYDIFLSAAAAPLWVGRITEAQRAAGGFIISTVGTVTAGGGAPAGGVDIGIIGTGAATSANPFLVNNAYTPQLITGVLCSDFEYVDVAVKVSCTDLRSLPTCTLAFFMQNALAANTGDWHLISTQVVSLLTAVGQPLEQQFRVTLGGGNNFAVLVDAISGNGTSLTAWIDLE